MPLISTLQEMLLSLLCVFTAPGGEIFLRLVAGWIVCPTRRTITAMIPFADPDGRCSHDAYHRFFRAGAWCVKELFHRLANVLVGALCPEGPIWVLTDDTVHKKTGRRVCDAKFCRDAVRSTGNRTVYVWGLQIVPLCLRVEPLPQWRDEPLALPINFRLYRKGGPTLLDLVEEMVNEVARWFPERRFYLVGDGFYAPLAGRAMTRTHVISRMRSDAAIYEMPPKRRSGKRGRPRKKGKRLPCPAAMAAHVRRWETVETRERGKTRKRLVYCRPVLWYKVRPDVPVLLVISRDPEGKEKDDFFVTTDLTLAGAVVISEFANRWPIEDTFRNVKQFLGAEHPQCWSGQGPQRAAAFPYLLYGVIWLWYINHAYPSTSLPTTPWYPSKRTPSFKDALASLRTALWRERFFQTVPRKAQMNKFQKLLVSALARAS
jgi:hypothetical protein